MIRFYGYSVVGISGQKYIITSCNSCDKKFIEQLMDGYSLFRFQKVGLINEEQGKDLHYEFLPILPTKDVGFPIDEYIEILDDSHSKKSRIFVKVYMINQS